MNVRRPKRFDVSNIEKCKELFSNLKEDEEGLVIIDGESNRIKLKQESYIKLSKIKSLKKKELFEHILGRLQVDQEYIEKLPEVVKEIAVMKKTWEEYKSSVHKIFDKIKPLALKSRKDFALEAVKHNCKGFLFAMLDGKTMQEAVKWSMVEKIFEEKKDTKVIK